MTFWGSFFSNKFLSDMHTKTHLRYFYFDFAEIVICLLKNLLAEVNIVFSLFKVYILLILKINSGDEDN